MEKEENYVLVKGIFKNTEINTENLCYIDVADSNNNVIYTTKNIFSEWIDSETINIWF